MAQGLVVPNYGQMGTEMLPAGNRMESPYGQAPATSSAPTDSVASMQGPAESAQANIGYRPVAGRADRLAANIVGGTTDSQGGGGYGNRI